jgi:succinate-acetate transporter protein
VAERSPVADRREPRPVPLLFGSLFMVIGAGAVLHEAGVVTVDAVTLIAPALLAGGAAALISSLLAVRRG